MGRRSAGSEKRLKTQRSAQERLELGAEGETGDPVHLLWPSEFPLTLCGVILPHATAKEARSKALGPICEHCAAYVARYPEGRRRSRQNPHRQQGG
jgi:hypothetical protein